MPNLSDFVGGGGFELIDSQTFTTSGTWTKPAAAEDNDIVVIDAWGGGASGASDSVSTDAAGGGGGGGFSREFVRSAALSATETVSVGAGGTSASSASGVDGGDSTFTLGGTITIGATGGLKGSVGNSTDAVGGEGGYSMQHISRVTNTGSATGDQKLDEWSAGWPNDTNISRSAAHTHSEKGGGAGGSDGSGSTQPGGNSVWAGAGGGVKEGGGSIVRAGGTSVYAGDGGDGGGTASTAGQAGSVPAGGGGGASGAASGAGGRGEVRVYVVRGASPDKDFVFEV